MQSSNISEATGDIANVIGYVRGKGVRLWLEDGQLRYKAPKGVLSREEIERLRESSREIVALLECSPGATVTEPELDLGLGPKSNHAPLAFSQLAHWNLYQLSRRPAIRQIASATRLCGRLNVDLLRECIAAMVDRHAALRTRIVLLNGIPTQEISEACNYVLEVRDLTAMPRTQREIEVKKVIDQLILAPIDPGVDPMFGSSLLKLTESEHVLIVAMEHMISDAYSMGILMRDLSNAYTQRLSGSYPSLPAIPVQFAEYAAWRRNTQGLWTKRHSAYWNERLAGCGRLRFPQDTRFEASSVAAGWGTIPLRISKSLRAELHTWSRLNCTTPVMSIFSAYVGLVLRWCNASEAIFQYQSDGRISAKVTNTMGYFSSPLSLRVELREDDHFVDLVRRVTEEYCQAYEHADYSYLEAQVPRPDFTRNCCFNWVPAAPNLDFAAAASLTWSPMSFEHPMLENLERDSEPFVLLFETENEIDGAVSFPRTRFSARTMECFTHNFLMFITELIRKPDKRPKSMLLLDDDVATGISTS
jgi:hypothetical protein